MLKILSPYGGHPLWQAVRSLPAGRDLRRPAAESLRVACYVSSKMLPLVGASRPRQRLLLIVSDLRGAGAPSAASRRSCKRPGAGTARAERALCGSFSGRGVGTFLQSSAAFDCSRLCDVLAQWPPAK